VKKTWLSGSHLDETFLSTSITWTEPFPASCTFDTQKTCKHDTPFTRKSSFEPGSTHKNFRGSLQWTLGQAWVRSARHNLDK